MTLGGDLSKITLRPGAKVTYQGREVGEVTDLKVEGDPAAVVAGLNLEPDIAAAIHGGYPITMATGGQLPPEWPGDCRNPAAGCWFEVDPCLNSTTADPIHCRRPVVPGTRYCADHQPAPKLWVPEMDDRIRPEHLAAEGPVPEFITVEAQAEMAAAGEALRLQLRRLGDGLRAVVETISAFAQAAQDATGQLSGEIKTTYGWRTVGDQRILAHWVVDTRRRRLRLHSTHPRRYFGPPRRAIYGVSPIAGAMVVMNVAVRMSSLVPPSSYIGFGTLPGPGRD